MAPSGSSSSTAASSNWLALRKKIAPSSSKPKHQKYHAQKQRQSSPAPSTSTATSFSFARGPRARSNSPTATDNDTITSLPLSSAGQQFNKAAVEYLTALAPSRGNSLLEMRQMVLGRSQGADSSSSITSTPGKYVALDCEMVGIGADGIESALARVSLVDYHGRVLLDVFVRPREQVTDWRTHVSGVRESDMKNALTFEDVQRQVSKLLDGRILVGHALSNDLTSLLLSHPRNQTRDTQQYCGKLKLAGSRPALRNLARLHFGIDIQKGEHSSVTDARAAMALYRVHAKAWEQVARGHVPTASTAGSADLSTPKSLGKQRLGGLARIAQAELATASSSTPTMAEPEAELSTRRLAKLAKRGTVVDLDESDEEEASVKAVVEKPKKKEKGKKRKRDESMRVVGADADADDGTADGIVLHLADADTDAAAANVDAELDAETSTRPAKRHKSDQSPRSSSSKTKVKVKAKSKGQTRISSGLSTVVRGAGGPRDKRSMTSGGGNTSGKADRSSDGGGKWWEILSGSGAKGSMRI